MDHIPDTGPNVIRVPYLAEESREGRLLDFADQQRYLDLQSSSNPTKRLGLLQRWLFFDCFTQVFNLADIDFVDSDFITTDDQGSKITTAELPNYLLKLLQFERAQASGQIERCGKIISYLRVLTKVAESNWQYGDESQDAADNSFVRDIGGPVLLQITMAARALGEACISIYKEEYDPEAGIVKNMVGARFLMDKMLAGGWCPRLVWSLMRMGNREFLYIGHTYGYATVSNADHSGCNPSSCVHELVDESTYQPRHLGPDACSCPMLEVDRTKVESIVRDGGIPVCRLLPVKKDDGTTELIIQVEPAGVNRPYVCISHVWAHGLGNPVFNGLPRCSIIGIQRTVDGVWHQLNSKGVRHPIDSYGCVHGFWMDTLCVPVHPSAKELRKKAISQMRDIYAGAVCSLVLDQTMQQRKTFISLSENFVAVALSPWAGRLWTLQEAVLAKRVVFLIHNGLAFEFDDLARQLLTILTGKGDFPINTRFYSTFAQTVIKVWRGLRPYVPFSELGPVPVEAEQGKPLSASETRMDTPTAIGVLNLLRHRSTSRATDETVCISTLLGLDTMTFLNTHGSDENATNEKRMILLLTTLGTLPSSIAFSPGPKLSAPGFRWAPRSFLQTKASESGTVMNKSAPGTVVRNKGLVACMDAIVISQAMSTTELANTPEFLLFEQGVVSEGPILVANPLAGDYHHRDLHVPQRGGDNPGGVLVLLFADNITPRVATAGLLGLVTDAHDIKALENVAAADFPIPGASYIIGEKDAQDDDAAITIGEPTYADYKTKAAGLQEITDQHITVECLKVMVVVRYSGSADQLHEKMENSVAIPGTLKIAGHWVLT